jgi:hypothetical protein
MRRLVSPDQIVCDHLEVPGRGFPVHRRPRRFQDVQEQTLLVGAVRRGDAQDAQGRGFRPWLLALPGPTEEAPEDHGLAVVRRPDDEQAVAGTASLVDLQAAPQRLAGPVVPDPDVAVDPGDALRIGQAEVGPCGFGDMVSG